jgi:hypothetical protein
MKSQFIIMHSRTLSPIQVKLILDSIKMVATLLNVADDTYLFGGDEQKVREIIGPHIGEWSISPIRKIG